MCLFQREGSGGGGREIRGLKLRVIVRGRICNTKQLSKYDHHVFSVDSDPIMKIMKMINKAHILVDCISVSMNYDDQALIME